MQEFTSGTGDIKAAYTKSVNEIQSLHEKIFQTSRKIYALQKRARYVTRKRSLRFFVMVDRLCCTDPSKFFEYYIEEKMEIQLGLRPDQCCISTGQYASGEVKKPLISAEELQKLKDKYLKHFPTTNCNDIKLWEDAYNSTDLKKNVLHKIAKKAKKSKKQ